MEELRDGEPVSCPHCGREYMIGALDGTDHSCMEAKLDEVQDAVNEIRNVIEQQSGKTRDVIQQLAYATATQRTHTVAWIVGFTFYAMIAAGWV